MALVEVHAPGIWWSPHTQLHVHVHVYMHVCMCWVGVCKLAITCKFPYSPVAFQKSEISPNNQKIILLCLHFLLKYNLILFSNTLMISIYGSTWASRGTVWEEGDIR